LRIVVLDALHCYKLIMPCRKKRIMLCKYKQIMLRGYKPIA